ncbi:MAG: succinate dehydrogenase/fumarate reductase iron-sulfur protein [Alphaproteobacteria bacterium]|jgi:succinate dehydrogenase/fumarate reductase iron-sulfur protein
MATIRITISRFTPSSDESPREQDYDLPVDGTISVLQAIRRIHRTLDGTLSFRNCDCRRGVCGLCSMMIDGKRRLACMCVAEDGMSVAPPPNRQVLKDLVFELD